MFPSMFPRMHKMPEIDAEFMRGSIERMEKERAVNNTLAAMVGVFAERIVYGSGQDLANALSDWLNFSLDRAINEAKNPLPSTSSYIPEDLIHATTQMQKLEDQKQQLLDMLAKMPEEMREMMDFTGTIFIQLMDGQIEHAQQVVSAIQKELEESAG